MQEEENIWTLRIGDVKEEDGGEYECQVTHSDGMEARIYKLDVVDEKDEESSETDLFVQSIETLSDDPSSTKPKSKSNRIKSLIERLKHSDDKQANSSNSSPETGWSESSLLLPVISLVTLSTVI